MIAATEIFVALLSFAGSLNIYVETPPSAGASDPELLTGLGNPGSWNWAVLGRPNYAVVRV